MTDPKITFERAGEVIARHIERLILEGTLRPGEALLPERDLADRLGTSRPTLREALKRLEDQGLLVQDGGKGKRVAPLGLARASDPLIALMARHEELGDDYLEFRSIVESAAAGMAAERASPVDLDRLRACMDRIEAAHLARNLDEEAAADTELHEIIYEASHSLVMMQVMRGLSGSLRDTVTRNRADLFSIPATRELLRDQHLAIARAILDRDPVAARQAAQDHLVFLRRATAEIRDARAKLDLSLRRLSHGGIGAARDGR